MQFQESETVELKRTYVDELRKEIIAMANGAGGTIYVGVNDDGTVEGVEAPDSMIQRIANGVRDAIKPDVTMFLHYETQTVSGKNILAISIQPGTNKPYYLAAKGLRPEGVFVRQGTSSVPASDAAIRRMIKETDGENYEDMRSLNQALTFEAAERAFRKENLAFGLSQMRSLGMMGADGLYTNLALLLSDQCPHIIKAATFSGENQQDFQDRREFGGSLLTQISDAYAYLDLRNHNHASFDGLYRTDQKDYPVPALREALLNAVVHRDYAFSAGTLISVYADRMEFVSVGGLVHGISLDDVLLGLSVCRNPKLANVFYRLKLIEAYGTGLKKIQSAYESDAQRPAFLATPNAFKVVLPRKAPHHTDSVSKRNAGERAATILEYIKANGSATRHDVEALLDVKTATAVRAIRELLDTGAIVTVGKGKNTRYVIAEK